MHLVDAVEGGMTCFHWYDGRHEEEEAAKYGQNQNTGAAS